MEVGAVGKFPDGCAGVEGCFDRYSFHSVHTVFLRLTIITLLF